MVATRNRAFSETCGISSADSCPQDQLREMMKQKGFEGQVFSGKDFRIEEDDDAGVAYNERVQLIE